MRQFHERWSPLLRGLTLLPRKFFDISTILRRAPPDYGEPYKLDIYDMVWRREPVLTDVEHHKRRRIAVAGGRLRDAMDCKRDFGLAESFRHERDAVRYYTGKFKRQCERGRKISWHLFWNHLFHASKVSSNQPTDIPVTLRLLAHISISISGPDFLLPDEDGTWTASVTGGVAPIHYQWYYYPVCPDGARTTGPQPLKPTCGYWYTNGADYYQWSHQDTYDFMVKCEATDALGTSVESNTIYVTVDGTFAKRSLGNTEAARDLTKEVTEGSFLQGSYPNPFNPATTLNFTLKERADVSLAVYDALGREVAVLAKGEHEAGNHRYVWDASSAPSGMYFARLTARAGTPANSFTRMTRLLLVR